MTATATSNLTRAWEIIGEHMSPEKAIADPEALARDIAAAFDALGHGSTLGAASGLREALTDEMVEDALQAAADAHGGYMNAAKTKGVKAAINSIRAALSQGAGGGEAFRSVVAAAAPPVLGSIPKWAKWCQPGDMQDKRRFIVRFDDPDRGDALFTDELEAREFYARASVSWNCWLFGALEAHPASPPAPSPRAAMEGTQS